MASYEEMKRELSRCFDLLRQIYVKDTDVEKMAMAKGALANVHRMLSEAEREQKEAGGNGK